MYPTTDSCKAAIVPVALAALTLWLGGAARCCAAPAPATEMPAAAGGAYRTTLAWSAHDVEDCRRAPTVTPAAGGGVTLVKRELIRDEIGRTVHSEAEAAAEAVGDDVWVRKDFLLETAAASAAELCVFANGRLAVTLNGRELPPYERVHVRARPYDGVYPADKFPADHPMHNMNGKPYHEFWQGGWERIPVAPELLTNGLNSVVLRATPGNALRFLIEPSLHPNRSAVSRDGGATWDYDNLSVSRVIDGEYMVRLLLTRHPASGWVESEPADLWPRPAGSAVALPARLLRLALAPEVETPAGGLLRLQVRLGTTPVFAPRAWSRWLSPQAVAAAGAGAPPWPAGSRFVQWRAELAAAADRQSAPALGAVKLSAEWAPQAQPGAAAPACRLTQIPIVRPSLPFAHARNSERLGILRQHTAVDAVVTNKTRGVDQLLAIARWTHDTFGSNAGGQLKTLNDWDALTLWHNARGKERLTGQMCTTRAAFFVQCATALGYPARSCLWSHATAEAWVDDLGQWVAFDPSGGFYFELDGKPASMLDVSMAWAGSNEGRPAGKVYEVKGPGSRKGPKDNAQLAWFSRFWVPPRSNFLESPEPMEPGHGTTGFKYDGDLRWLHPAKDPLPWFSLGTSRRGDLAFTVNTVNLHLALGKEAGAIEVLVENDEPAPARIEARFGQGEWTKVEPAFVWKPAANGAPLEVRAVNAFGFSGRAARVDMLPNLRE